MSRPEFTVHVVPQFLPEESAPEQNQFAFAYTVIIVNSGNVTGQLIGRHWIINDARGTTQEVRGLAVVGQQPVLKPGERFEYTSWTRIATPTGAMRGSFFCVTDEVKPFEAEVAQFDLDSRDVEGASPPDDAPRVLH
jgi:ApaG protein